jgi:hypothetical protein
MHLQFWSRVNSRTSCQLVIKLSREVSGEHNNRIVSSDPRLDQANQRGLDSETTNKSLRDSASYDYTILGDLFSSRETHARGLPHRGKGRFESLHKVRKSRTVSSGQRIVLEYCRNSVAYSLRSLLALLKGQSDCCLFWSRDCLLRVHIPF